MKFKGFTLIELIVVMAIIAVLAGLLVPNMFHYINEAKYDDANSMARIVYNSAAQYCVEYKVNDVWYINSDKTVQEKKNPYDEINEQIIGDLCYNRFEIGEFEPDTTHSVSLGSLEMAAEKYISDKSSIDTTGSSAIVVIDKNGTVVRAFWADDADSKYVGAYPNPVDPDEPEFTLIGEVISKATT